VPLQPDKQLCHSLWRYAFSEHPTSRGTITSRRSTNAAGGQSPSVSQRTARLCAHDLWSLPAPLLVVTLVFCGRLFRLRSFSTATKLQYSGRLCLNTRSGPYYLPFRYSYMAITALAQSLNILKKVATTPPMIISGRIDIRAPLLMKGSCRSSMDPLPCDAIASLTP